MALPSLFRRARADEPAPAPRVPRRAVPPPGELRRERRQLLRLREERIRDVGGLALEMFRQDSFREYLLYEQCAAVAAIEDRLHELEALLQPRRAPAARCVCGATVRYGARFCATCGRPWGEAAVACSTCGHALPADAQFCPACSTPTEATQGR